MSVPFGFPAWRKLLEDTAPDAKVQQRIVGLLDQGQYEEAAGALLEARGGNAFQATLEHTFGERRLPEPLPSTPLARAAGCWSPRATRRS